MLRRCNSDDFGGRQWSSLAVLPSTMLPRAHYARRRSSSHTLQHPRRSASSSFSSSSSSSSSKSSTLKASSREVHMRALSELQSAASRLPHPEVVYGAMIPEPDYSDDERETQPASVSSMVARNNKVNTNNSNNKEQEKGQQAASERVDGRGLIMPKKLVNPCLESSDKMNLHRELKFNQKMGVNVLNQKTELQKAMEKHNDKKVLREQQEKKQAEMTPFQKALDERAQKIEQMEKAEKGDVENEQTPSCEFQKIHAKVRAKMEVQ